MSPVASSADSSIGLKRNRDNHGQDPEATDAPSGTDADAREEAPGSSDSGTAAGDVIEGSPPQKKQKVHGSVSSIPIPSITVADPLVGTTKVPRTKNRGSEGKSKQQAVQGTLSDISKACSLRHVSSKFLSSDHGPLTFGDKVDALVGGITFRYVLFAVLDDAAPSGSLNAHQATWAHRTLFSAQLTKRVASALGFPEAPKEHDPFMCALGRATYNRSIQEIRDTIFEIYEPIVRSVIKAVAPLQSTSDDTRSLDSRRQHLRDLLELSSQGYEYHSCLSPFETVLTTADHIVAAMLTEDLLTDLGIIRPVVSST
ncbi:uncharacterized protein SCHCODRAFT_02640780 [Schizophyllum commune H4-8]|uniref:uncharacterized protein n=1 Tax=Schizophyllum commune (strain H4-8 / FGSC 9210) TaxID=578458 RepID=UPI00215DF4EF|nr:uncharacterized protein SCHCODRAFT_02640780 [Schizophyllum commune H4-8]KAI5887121.1 hypothetical protein SCHCODRAFT_02640780 [Schizophyllum commune H4-8]